MFFGTLITTFLVSFGLIANDVLPQPLIQEHGQFFSLKWARYLEKGGRSDSIIEVKSKKDLYSLIENHTRPKTINIRGKEHRFNYILTSKKVLRLSKLAKTSSMRVSQDLLTKGDSIIAAGEIYIFGNPNHPLIGITNRSKKFCTPLQRLDIVQENLIKIGISKKSVQKIDYQAKFCKLSKRKAH